MCQKNGVKAIGAGGIGELRRVETHFRLEELALVVSCPPAKPLPPLHPTPFHPFSSDPPRISHRSQVRVAGASSITSSQHNPPANPA